jgi:hypothetical protein
MTDIVYPPLLGLIIYIIASLNLDAIASEQNFATGHLIKRVVAF